MLQTAQACAQPSIGRVPDIMHHGGSCTELHLDGGHQLATPGHEGPHTAQECVADRQNDVPLLGAQPGAAHHLQPGSWRHQKRRAWSAACRRCRDAGSVADAARCELAISSGSWVYGALLSSSSSSSNGKTSSCAQNPTIWSPLPGSTTPWQVTYTLARNRNSLLLMPGSHAAGTFLGLVDSGG